MDELSSNLNAILSRKDRESHINVIGKFDKNWEANGNSKRLLNSSLKITNSLFA